jgi:hypothetical protein
MQSSSIPFLPISLKTPLSKSQRDRKHHDPSFFPCFAITFTIYAGRGTLDTLVGVGFSAQRGLPPDITGGAVLGGATMSPDGANLTLFSRGESLEAGLFGGPMTCGFPNVGMGIGVERTLGGENCIPRCGILGA